MPSAEIASIANFLLEAIIAGGLIALAIERWVRGRESNEKAIRHEAALDGQSTTKDLTRLCEELEALDEYAHSVGKQGHEHANRIGKLETELELRAIATEKDLTRYEQQITENTRRVDELYRALKRNGAAT